MKLNLLRSSFWQSRPGAAASAIGCPGWERAPGGPWQRRARRRTAELEPCELSWVNFGALGISQLWQTRGGRKHTAGVRPVPLEAGWAEVLSLGRLLRCLKTHPELNNI